MSWPSGNTYQEVNVNEPRQLKWIPLVFVAGAWLQNGLYAPKPFGVSPYAISPYASPCLTAEYRCTQQAQ